MQYKPTKITISFEVDFPNAAEAVKTLTQAFREAREGVLPDSPEEAEEDSNEPVKDYEAVAPPVGTPVACTCSWRWSNERRAAIHYVALDCLVHGEHSAWYQNGHSEDSKPYEEPDSADDPLRGRVADRTHRDWPITNG